MSVTTGTFPGVRIVDMPDLGAVTDTSSMVGERAGSGRFAATAFFDYISNGLAPVLAQKLAIVPTIAALRTLASGTAAVYVQGYYAAGDGGGGVYNRSAAAGADNAGTVIVSANGTYLLDTRGAPYSVKSFGAKGDLVTDDAPAIQACVNAALSAGAAVYVNGRFLCGASITGTIPAGQSFALFGDSQGLSELRFGNTDGVFLIYAAANWWDNPNTADVHSLSVTTTAANTHTALAFEASFTSGNVQRPTTVRDVSICGTVKATTQWATALVYNGVPQTLTDNVFITGQQNTQTAVGISYIGASGGVATAHTVRGGSVWFLNQGAHINAYIQGVVFDGWNATAVNYGVDADGLLVAGLPTIQQVSIVGSTQINAQLACVALTGVVDCQIIGNLFLLAGSASNTSLVAIDSFLRCQIVGNDFVGSALSSSQTGLTLFNTLSVPEAGFPSTVEANTFQDVQYGIGMVAATAGIHVGFSNVAGTGTTALINNASTGNVVVTKGAADSGGTGFAALVTAN